MAQTLLQLALTLLIAAQGVNVPESLQNQAIQVAQYAIVVSMEELKKPVKTEAELVDIAPNLPKEEAPKWPIIGESSNGLPVYKGTGNFVIEEDGCHYPVVSIAGKWYKQGTRTWCPPK